MKWLWVPMMLFACAPWAVAVAAPDPTLDAIARRFHAGLADPGCRDAPRRWHRHYADVGKRLRNPRERQLRNDFDHVLGAVRSAGLPSELALIPFVESRYRRSARSPWGQVGLWQFTAATARRNGLSLAAGNDERLDPVASTAAAVRYLRRLHRDFGRDWRWTAVAFNAGEGAARKARRAGGFQRLPPIARHYPDKLHALACAVPPATRD